MAENNNEVERLQRELEDERRRRSQAEEDARRRQTYPAYDEPQQPYMPPEPAKKGGGGGLLSAALIALVMGAVACWVLFSLFFGPNMISKTDFDANYHSLETWVDDNFVRPSEVTIPSLADYAKKTDIPIITTPDLSGYLQTANFSTAMTNWWNANAEAKLDEWWASHGGTTTPPVVTGDVSVVIDLTDTTFYSGTTATSHSFPVKITNGSSAYKNVTFGLVLQCVSTDVKANVKYDTTTTPKTPSMTVNSVAMSDPIFVAEALSGGYYPNCHYVYFYWGSSSSIPLAPGQSTTVYVVLSNFASSVDYEVWQAAITSVVATNM